MRLRGSQCGRWRRESVWQSLRIWIWRSCWAAFRRRPESASWSAPARRPSEKDQALLRAYFAAGRSLKRTCETLYLHKNTLQYQLDRIHRETGYNPRCFADAVVLYLALKLS